MKKTFLLFLLAAALRTEAQIFAPLPTDQAVWANVLFTGWAMDYCCVSKTAFFGDTVIDGETYKNAYRNLPWDNGGVFDPDSAYYVGSLRHEPSVPGPKIWMRWSGETTDRLLYDFSVLPGDTVIVRPLEGFPDDTLRKVVEAYVQIPNTQLWALQFDGGEEYWISGVGSTRGVLNPFLEVINAFFYLAFSCQDGDLYFQNYDSLQNPQLFTYLQSVYGDTGLYPCADNFTFAPPNGAAESAPRPAWIIRPNPATDYVEILRPGPAGSEMTLTLLSPDGRLLHRQTLPAGAELARISLAAFPDGLLTIRLTGRLESRQFRLLKTGR